MTAPNRRGVSTIWVLVVLAVLGTASVTTTRMFLAARRDLDGREQRTAARWLARDGVELAVARLLENPDDYTGEEVKPVPGSTVRIAVRKVPTAEDTYRVECEARYQSLTPHPAVQTAARTLKRTRGPNGPRVEVVAE